MIISNLTYTELASEANNIEGGDAVAEALAGALAAGPDFASAGTLTATTAVVNLLGSFATSLSQAFSIAG